MNDENAKQLDWLQRGLFQQAFFIFAFLIWLAVTASLAFCFIKINAQSSIADQIIGFIQGVFIGLVILYLILPWITWTMFTKTQKLKQAIDVDHFFRHLNIKTKERLSYIKINKLNVFIADKPLNDYIENDIKAAYFYFLTRFLPLKTNWYVALGQKRACFDLTQVGTLIDLTELEIELLKKINIELETKIQALTREVKSTKANAARDAMYDKQDMLLWRICNPMLAELITQGQASGKKYIRNDIENYFKEYSANYPEDVEKIKVLQKTPEVGDIKLPRKILDTLAAELEEKGLKQGHGRPKN